MRNLVSAWCGIFGLVLVAGCSDGDSSTGTGGSGGAGGSAGTTAGTAGVGAGGSGGTAGTSVGGSAGAAGSAGTGGSAVGGTGGTQVTQVARVEIYSEDFCNFCTEFSIGVQRKFAARAYDESDNEVTTTFAWSTSDASIAEVDQTGLVTGIAEGEVTLLASAEGVDGSSLLTITPEHVAWVEVSPNQSTLNSVGATQQFTAKAYGDLGNELSNVSFEWLTANALVANVDQSGVATAAGRGLTAIQVIANGWTTGHAMLTVIDPVPAGTPFALTSVTGGGHHGCGVNATNRAYCWGWNYYGQLGNGGVLPTTAHASTPQLVKGGHAFAQVTAGLYHTCAVDTAGKGFCWGFQEGGQLGNGKTTPDAVKEPAEILGNLTFERLSAGGSHTCGIDVNKKLYCWGSGIEGALGVGHDQNLSQPTPVSPSEDWMDVVTGLWSTCALRANGKAYCWGDDEMGQLGNGQPLTDSNVPQPVAGDLVFTSLDTYRATICGVTDAQEVWCWGVNDFDQIGEGQGQAVPEPVKLTGGGPAIAVAAGSFHTCIVEAGGAAQCRGESSYGQTGTGVIGQDPTWQPVVGNQHYASIEVGSHFSCGIVSGQGAYCWGDNGFGQLASGLTGGVEPSFSPTPWPMAAP